MLGDGSLIRQKNKKGHQVFRLRLGVKSEAFAQRFKGYVETCIGRKAWMKSYFISRKGNAKIKMPPTSGTEWIVIATSREWYQKIEPIKTMSNYVEIRTKGAEFQNGALSGLLDSEGYVNHQHHYTDIANKNMALLKLAAALAQGMGYRTGIYGPYSYSRGVAHLRINGCLNKVE